MRAEDKKWTCSVADLAGATGGKILQPSVSMFLGVGTDTRMDLTSRLYVALKGDRFDGHDFVDQAIEKGAAAVMVHEWREAWKPLLSRASFIQVADTLQGLQAFARHWRHKNKFKVFAITGSNGKTSTKEFTTKILQKKFSVFSSKGSFNNHWGVPLSILSAGPEHTHLVLEFGMNHSGEIWRLCQIAEPDVVVVTSVGRAHIGELGSQENVAKAKEEIYMACPNSIHVFNVDNEWTMRMHANSQSPQKITFSAFNPDVDVHLRAQRFNWEGLDIVGHIRRKEGQVNVRVFGRQNTVNLMAAASLALASGMEPDAIWSAMGTIADISWGRNQIIETKTGAKILFDAYNANPDSMQALLKNLYEMDVQGRKFFVAADMGELGSFSEAAHEEIGEKAGRVGFEMIWYVGSFGDAFAKGLKKSGAPTEFHYTKEMDPGLASTMWNRLQDGDLVAMKASRSMALERVLKLWGIDAV